MTTSETASFSAPLNSSTKPPNVSRLPYLPKVPSISKTFYSSFDSTVAYTHYEGDRHLHPERLPSARAERIVTIRLLHGSKQSLENVKQYAKHLRRLSAKGLRMNSLPDRFTERLKRLEKLDVSWNRLDDHSLPQTLSNLRNLVELRLTHNKLTAIPSSLGCLVNLRRLDVSHNKIDDLSHLELAVKLESLILDYNMISSLFPFVSTMKFLHILHCSNNEINTVERDVRYIRTIKEIDLSRNNLYALSSDILLLPNLESLNVSRNKINKINMNLVNMPTRRRWLHSVDLSENCLTKLPEQLLLLVRHLDVSSNKIKVITGSIIKTLKWRTRQTLKLEHNPINYPPAEICYSGIGSIVQYLLERRLESDVHQGLKVIVVGQAGCGKSSLMQSLVDQESRLEEDHVDSCGINIYEYTCDRGDDRYKLELTIWDCCGQSFYKFPYSFICDNSFVALIAFDLSLYTSDLFYDTIGQWIDLFIARGNRLAFILVATKSDRIDASNADIALVLQTVRRDLEYFLERRIQEISAIIKQIESRPFISSALSEHLKVLFGIKTASIIFPPNVIVTSSKAYTGFVDLQLAIEDIASDMKFFPDVGRVLPTFWLDVQQYLDDRGNATFFPVMQWSEYEREITSKFGMKHLIVDISTYLHRTGKIIWLSDINNLKDVVFIRPSWLFEVLKVVLRHDVKEYLSVLQEEVSADKERTDDILTRAKDNVSYYGLYEKQIIKKLLSAILPTDSQKPLKQVLQLLVHKLNLALPMSSSQENEKKLEVNKIKSEQESALETYEHFLFPYYLPRAKPVKLPIKGKNRITAVFNFPQFYPSGIFEIFCNRFCKESNKVKVSEIRKTGINGRHVYNQIDLRAELCETTPSFPVTLSIDQSTKVPDQNKTKQKINRVFVHCNWIRRTEPTSKHEVWRTLIPLINEMEDILTRFPGLAVTRNVVCPDCGESSFDGEWQSLNEIQNATVKPCPSCGELIDAGLLVQPKDKQNDDISQRLAKLKLEIVAPAKRVMSSQDQIRQRSMKLPPKLDVNLRPKSDLK